MNNRSLITGKSKGGWKGRWRDGSIKRKTDPSIKVRVIYEALTFYDPSLRSTTTLSLYSPAGARFFFHGILEKCTNRNERSIHPRSHSKHRLEEILWLAGDKEKLGGASSSERESGVESNRAIERPQEIELYAWSGDNWHW